MKTTATSGEAATPGALDGFRVLELSSVIMAPHATRVLHDLGAEVVKVATGGGDLNRVMGGGPHLDLARQGLSYQDAAPARPRLIYCQAEVGYTAGENSAMVADGAAEVRAI